MTLDKDAFEKLARPVAERLIGHALTTGANKYGITDIHVAATAMDELSLTFLNGQETSGIGGQKLGVTVQIFSGDKSLAFAQSGMDETRLIAALDNHMRMIRLAPGNPNTLPLEREKVWHGPEADLELCATQIPSQDELREYARALSAAAQQGPNICNVETLASSGEECQFTLASNGLERLSHATCFTGDAEATVRDSAGNMQIGMARSAAVYFNDMAAPASIGAEAAHKAAARLDATKPATGPLPVVLSPEAAASFFLNVYRAANGMQIYSNASFFRDCIGQQVMNEGITIVDDPGIIRGLASGTVDAAGMKSGPITLIEHGVLKSYYMSLMEARLLGLEPSGREGTGGKPTNMLVCPGKWSPGDLISDITDGVLVRGWMNGTQDVNNGTYSMPAYGHRIRNGKITDEALDGFGIAGNLRDIFLTVVVANDTPKLPNTRSPLAAPTTRLYGVTVAAR